MNKIIVLITLMQFLNFNKIFSQEIKTTSNNNRYAAIIFIPFDSAKSNVSYRVENIKLKDSGFRSGNKAFWVGKQREENSSEVDVLRTSYLIVIDTTQCFSALQLNLDSVKIFTMMDVCNHISIELRTFFRQYRNKMLVLSNFDSQYKFYPVKQTETFYNGAE